MNGWIEITPSQTAINAAKNRAASISINKDLGLSKFGSEHRRLITGYLGEEIFIQHFKLDSVSDHFDYDILSKNGAKIEVKTISCKSAPLPHYLCVVNSHDLSGVHKQASDYYVFLRVLNDYSKAWILGYIRCKDFFSKGEFIEKGRDFGSFTFTKANATALPISMLELF